MSKTTFCIHHVQQSFCVFAEKHQHRTWTGLEPMTPCLLAQRNVNFTKNAIRQLFKKHKKKKKNSFVSFSQKCSQVKINAKYMYQ